MDDGRTAKFTRQEREAIEAHFRGLAFLRETAKRWTRPAFAARIAALNDRSTPSRSLAKCPIVSVAKLS